MKHLVLAICMFTAGVAGAPGAWAQDPAAATPTAPTPPETVAAAPAKPGMDNAISAFGVFGYYYASTGVGVGVAGRYQKTIVPKGLLHLANLHEDLGIEGGLDYYHYNFDGGYSYDEFAVLVGVVWNFWFADGKLALYPKLESGFGFGSMSGAGVGLGGYGGFHALAEAGIAYKVGALTLRGEVGSGALRAGAGLVF